MKEGNNLVGLFVGTRTQGVPFSYSSMASSVQRATDLCHNRARLTDVPDGAFPTDFVARTGQVRPPAAHAVVGGAIAAIAGTQGCEVGG